MGESAERQVRDGKVGALLHGLAVLDMFGRDRTVVGVADIAKSLSVHRSTASRLAATLASAGYLEPAGEQGRYRLAAKLATLGAIAAAETDLRRAAAGPLGDLVSRLGETGHLGVLEGTETVTVEVIDGWQTVRMHSWVGKRSPAHCSSMGKALLAGLSPAQFKARYPDTELERRTPATIANRDELESQLAEIRARGYAEDLEELEAHLCCIAAPVFGRDGEVVASISVSGPASRLGDPATRATAAPEVTAAARAISARLGAHLEMRLVMDCAGVVLAGGRSSRMGTPKAALEWHGSTLLRRTVGIVARAANGPVVVVRAAGQDLPSLPAGVIVAEDPRPGKGPVQGIAAGLAALRGQAEVAFVCSTDMPFLHPAFVRRVLRVLAERDGPDVALPVARGFQQPLAAAYRVSLADAAERLVMEDRLRPAFLFDQCRVERLDDATLGQDPVLAALDPDLDSVVNVNEPADYEAARARPAPEVTVQLFGILAQSSGPRAVRAATVGAAAEAVGLAFDGHVTVALNGDQITRDPSVPLAAGDTVFMSADDRGGNGPSSVHRGGR